MEKRITVLELRDKLTEAIEKGLQDRFIGVAEYYLGKEINLTDDEDSKIWNTIFIEEVYHEDIPVTEEQEEYMRKQNEEFMKNNPEFNGSFFDFNDEN